MYSNGYNEYAYTDVPTFPQPQPQQQASFTGSTCTEKPQNPSAILVAAQERASHKSVVRKTFLITAAILISIAGLVFAFLSFLCVFHQCQVEKLSVVSTAPLGRVLTISQVTSHVAPLSVPIIMGLFSYLLAAQWLRSSNSGGPDRPSPMQLGLLMSMCDGAGLSALFSSIKYTATAPPNGKQKLATPHILRQSIIFLGSLLAVTYITAAADSWLHASSNSVIIPSIKPYQSTIAPNFGREINATTCGIASQGNNGTLDAKLAGTCGLFNGGAHGTTAELGEGIRVVDNSSTVHEMVLTDDQTVIVIPLNTPPNITYTAKTLGVKSKCATITKQCMTPKTDANGLVDYGPDPVLYMDCTKAGIKYVNSTTQMGMCALDSQGLCTEWDTIPSNPFVVGEVMTSMAYIDPDTTYSQFLNNTGWFFHGESGAWNIVLCNVSVLDVTYSYESSRYTTQSSSLAPLNTTRAIVSPLFIVNSGTAVVSKAVDGAGSTNNPPYELVYSFELSRQLLGRAGYIYAPAHVLQIQSEVDVNGSKLQLIPFVIFLVSLGIFACQVLYISIRVIIGTWNTQYVELAALHLRDPLITVNRLYGQPNPALTWDASADKRFGDNEMEGDRLCVGPRRVSGDPAHGSIFMVTKG